MTYLHCAVSISNVFKLNLQSVNDFLLLLAYDHWTNNQENNNIYGNASSSRHNTVN